MTKTNTMNTDQFMSALCALREAGGETIQAKMGVVSVIRNRAADPKNRWPKNVTDVIAQPYQFSSFNVGAAGSGVWPSPRQPYEWKAWLDSIAVATAALAADPTDGATFYHDVSIAPPFEAWLGKTATLADLERLRTVQIGRLIFYRL